MLSYPDAAAELMEHLCTHDAHGYSQPNRAGVGTGATEGERVTLSDGTVVGIAIGDRDCSSAAIECYAALGVDCGGAWYTGDMVADMVASGNFKQLPRSSWGSSQRGDLLVNQGVHVAMALGSGRLGEAAISETGGIHGQVGDQTGREVRITAMYDDNWDCVLRYCGPEREDEVTDTDIKKIAEAVWNFEQNGVLMRDRMQGTDEAANKAREELTRTDDPSGRDVHMSLFTHFKWVAAAVQTGLDYLKAIAAKVGAEVEE